jgi:hypothetical protein
MPFMMRQLSLRDSLPHSVMWQMNAMRTWRDFVLTLPLVKVANECDADLERFCADIAVGEGRVLKCLDENSSKINERCSQALKDVGAN